MGKAKVTKDDVVEAAVRFFERWRPEVWPASPDALGAKEAKQIRLLIQRYKRGFK